MCSSDLHHKPASPTTAIPTTIAGFDCLRIQQPCTPRPSLCTPSISPGVPRFRDHRVAMNPPGSRWRMSPSASSCLSSTRSLACSSQPDSKFVRPGSSTVDLFFYIGRGYSHEGGAPHLRSTRRHRRGPSSRARIQPGFLIAVSGGPRAEDHLTWPMQRRAGRAPFLSRPRPCSSRDTATSSTRHHHPSLPTELASRRRVGVQLIGSLPVFLTTSCSSLVAFTHPEATPYWSEQEKALSHSCSSPGISKLFGCPRMRFRACGAGVFMSSSFSHECNSLFSSRLFTFLIYAVLVGRPMVLLWNNT